MSNHILANLSFNPSSVEQLKPHSQRFRRESAVRLLGVIVSALNLLVVAVAWKFPMSNPDDLIKKFTTPLDVSPQVTLGFFSIIFIVAGYFYLRSRWLAKEMLLVRKSFSAIAGKKS